MIQVENLKFSYPKSETLAVNDISFDVAKGEIFGFLGPSGAGKSTVQKILYKLLSNYTGKASIDGKDLKDWNKELYERIGVCFELPNHYLKLTAKENLEFFRGFYKHGEKPENMLRLLGLESHADKKVSEFSKGMKMRLNFLRSFIHDPDILFLDEPTSGLDPVNARQVKDLILDLKSKGKTIFITTHQMHDADELCDRVAFMVDGKIPVMDSPRNLKMKYSQHLVEVKTSNSDESYEFPLQNLGNNAGFKALLNQNNINSIHSKEATLDDVFIKVTGKSLL